MTAPLLAQSPVAAPVPATPATPPAAVVVDAAHGGTDLGAKIGDNTLEKDVNWQIAARLRSLLLARGFDLRLTRDGDPTPAPTANERAGLANNAHAIACVLIHSTGSGAGVHLYSSSLTEKPALDTAAEARLTKWNEAQSQYVARSVKLMETMRDAFDRAKIVVSSGKSWITPMDAMQCPTVVVEVGPLPEKKETKQPMDGGYQQRVAETLAGVLLAWKSSGLAVKP